LPPRVARWRICGVARPSADAAMPGYAEAMRASAAMAAMLVKG
jgi:hypothetical protein